MIFVKNSRGGREVNMINTLSKINLSKIGWEGGRSTSIWIMSLNILLFFGDYPLLNVVKYNVIIGIFNKMKYIFLNSSIYLWLQYGDHVRKVKKSLRKQMQNMILLTKINSYGYPIMLITSIYFSEMYQVHLMLL